MDGEWTHPWALTLETLVQIPVLHFLMQSLSKWLLSPLSLNSALHYGGMMMITIISTHKVGRLEEMTELNGRVHTVSLTRDRHD